MIAEMSIYPLDRNTHMSADIARVVNVLAASGIEYQVGPMGTSIRGTSDQVFAAIKACHEVLARDHDRIVMNVTLDDRRQDEHSLAGMVESVETKVPRWRAGEGSAQREQ